MKCKIAIQSKQFEVANELFNDSITNFTQDIYRLEYYYLFRVELFYELNDEMIFVYIDRLNSYLKYNKDKLRAITINSSIKFKNTVVTLLNFKNEINITISKKSKLAKFYDELYSYDLQIVYDKHWLLEKVEELKVKYGI